MTFPLTSVARLSIYVTWGAHELTLRSSANQAYDAFCKLGSVGWNICYLLLLLLLLLFF